MTKNVALVLSAGGARGCAHIGAIKALEQQGFTITSVAGTSMGALVGGIYATGQLRQFEAWISSLEIMEILSLIDFSISRKGLIKGKKVFERIKEIVPEQNIEDLKIPFCAVATDIIRGRETVFTEGNLFEAIRASVSIPTVFQPYMIGQSYFVDGGLLNPIPVNRVKRIPGDMLVVVDVSADIPPREKDEKNLTAENESHPEQIHSEQIKIIKDKLSNPIPAKKSDELGIFNLSNKSLTIMTHKISELTLATHQPDLLIPISRDSYSIFDFYKAKEIIAEGEIATLEELKRKEFI